jgi:tetratricopeptide (TPR) repeat protein
LLTSGVEDALQQAANEFEKALIHDSEYALAHAELAMATISVTRRTSDSVDGMAKAANHISQAMALDPTLAETHLANGHLLWSQSKYEEALIEFRNAIRINPSYVYAYFQLSNILNKELGRYDEAFEFRKMAIQVDPLSQPSIDAYLRALIDRNMFVEHDRELQKIESIFPHIYAFRRGSRDALGGFTAIALLAKLEALRINPDYGRVWVGLPFDLSIVGLEGEALTAVFADNESTILSYLGRPDDAVRAAETRYAEDPDSLSARHNLGLALAGAGDYARAGPMLEEMWLLSGERVFQNSSLFPIASGVALIAIRHAANDEAGVEEIVAAIQDNVRRYRKAGIVGRSPYYSADYEDGLSSYLSGDRERGLALLNKATASGIFVPLNVAYMQPFYDDPGFVPILERQQIRQARERNKVLAVVCADNPYESVWQPEDGTCEGFSPAAGK